MSKMHESQAKVMAQLLNPESPYNLQIRAAPSTRTELNNEDSLVKKFLNYSLAIAGIVALAFAISSEPTHLESLEIMVQQRGHLPFCENVDYLDNLLFPYNCK